jgi:hypothetical protein
MKAAAERAVERLHLKMAVKDFEGARAAWKIAARAGFPQFYYSVYLIYQYKSTNTDTPAVEEARRDELMTAQRTDVKELKKAAAEYSRRRQVSAYSQHMCPQLLSLAAAMSVSEY